MKKEIIMVLSSSLFFFEAMPPPLTGPGGGKVALASPLCPPLWMAKQYLHEVTANSITLDMNEFVTLVSLLLDFSILMTVSVLHNKTRFFY